MNQKRIDFLEKFSKKELGKTHNENIGKRKLLCYELDGVNFVYLIGKNNKEVTTKLNDIMFDYLLHPYELGKLKVTSYCKRPLFDTKIDLRDVNRNMFSDTFTSLNFTLNAKVYLFNLEEEKLYEVIYGNNYREINVWYSVLLDEII